jgi:hypothetical protein
MNRTHLRYGNGRLDAVGFILNKVAYVAKPDAPSVNEPDAPVSYPFLWNIGQQTRVQWDGIAQNAFIGPLDVGALGRNTGEVIGVFADVQTPDLLHWHFRSSVRADNLVAIEGQVATLRPPRWPRALLPVDDALAAEGRQLFAQRCADCHTPLPRTDNATRRRPDGTPLERLNVLFPQQLNDPAVAAEITPATSDTDRWMACNTVMNQADTGRLKRLPTGDSMTSFFGDRAASSLMLAAVVKGVDISALPQLLREGFASWRGSTPPLQAPRPPGFAAFAAASPAQVYASRSARCDAYARQPANFKEVGYKARPLTGVWATAPFLHNGSVPTLYDLLLPPAQRPRSFFLGSREFDPTKVGYRTDAGPENTFRFDVTDATGQVVEGNSNLGHDYGNATLSDHQRWAIVEYLKVIGE